jgi:hypothetical protein
MSKLCECGCGKEVIWSKANFLRGHSNKSLEVKEKKRLSYQKHYGTDSPNQSEEIKEKIKQTCMNRYGVEFVTQLKETKDKIQQTCLNKYGVSSPMQSKEIQKKKNQTCLEKYGGPAPYCSKEVQEKGQTTLELRTGYKFSGQIPEVKQKSKLTCIEHFGVDNYGKTLQSKKYNKEFMIQYRIDHPNDGWSPNKGKYEKEVFNELQKYCFYQLLEDQQFLKYHPDRYIKELNLIIELYEPWHKYSGWIKHDPVRQKDLEDHLHCRFFVIWLKDWQENKDQIIKEFQSLLNLKEYILC